MTNDVVTKFDIISQAMTFYETQQLIKPEIAEMVTPFNEGNLFEKF